MSLRSVIYIHINCIVYVYSIVFKVQVDFDCCNVNIHFLLDLYYSNFTPHFYYTIVKTNPLYIIHKPKNMNINFQQLHLLMLSILFIQVSNQARQCSSRNTHFLSMYHYNVFTLYIHRIVYLYIQFITIFVAYGPSTYQDISN